MPGIAIDQVVNSLTALGQGKLVIVLNALKAPGAPLENVEVGVGDGVTADQIAQEVVRTLAAAGTGVNTAVTMGPALYAALHLNHAEKTGVVGAHNVPVDVFTNNVQRVLIDQDAEDFLGQALWRNLVDQATTAGASAAQLLALLQDNTANNQTTIQDHLAAHPIKTLNDFKKELTVELVNADRFDPSRAAALHTAVTEGLDELLDSHATIAQGATTDSIFDLLSNGQKNIIKLVQEAKLDRQLSGFEGLFNGIPNNVDVAANHDPRVANWQEVLDTIFKTVLRLPFGDLNAAATPQIRTAIETVLQAKFGLAPGIIPVTLSTIWTNVQDKFFGRPNANPAFINPIVDEIIKGINDGSIVYVPGDAASEKAAVQAALRKWAGNQPLNIDDSLFDAIFDKISNGQKTRIKLMAQAKAEQVNNTNPEIINLLKAIGLIGFADVNRAKANAIDAHLDANNIELPALMQALTEAVIAVDTSNLDNVVAPIRTVLQNKLGTAIDATVVTDAEIKVIWSATKKYLAAPVLGGAADDVHDRGLANLAALIEAANLKISSGQPADNITELKNLLTLNVDAIKERLDNALAPKTLDEFATAIAIEMAKDYDIGVDLVEANRQRQTVIILKRALDLAGVNLVAQGITENTLAEEVWTKIFKVPQQNYFKFVYEIRNTVNGLHLVGVADGNDEFVQWLQKPEVAKHLIAKMGTPPQGLRLEDFTSDKIRKAVVQGLLNDIANTDDPDNSPLYGVKVGQKLLALGWFSGGGLPALNGVQQVALAANFLSVSQKSQIKLVKEAKRIHGLGAVEPKIAAFIELLKNANINLNPPGTINLAALHTEIIRKITADNSSLTANEKFKKALREVLFHGVAPGEIPAISDAVVEEYQKLLPKEQKNYLTLVANQRLALAAPFLLSFLKEAALQRELLTAGVLTSSVNVDRLLAAIEAINPLDRTAAPNDPETKMRNALIVGLGLDVAEPTHANAIREINRIDLAAATKLVGELRMSSAVQYMPALREWMQDPARRAARWDAAATNIGSLAATQWRSQLNTQLGTLAAATDRPSLERALSANVDGCLFKNGVGVHAALIPEIFNGDPQQNNKIKQAIGNARILAYAGASLAQWLNTQPALLEKLSEIHPQQAAVFLNELERRLIAAPVSTDIDLRNARALFALTGAPQINLPGGAGVAAAVPDFKLFTLPQPDNTVLTGEQLRAIRADAMRRNLVKQAQTLGLQVLAKALSDPTKTQQINKDIANSTSKNIAIYTDSIQRIATPYPAENAVQSCLRDISKALTADTVGVHNEQKNVKKCEAIRHAVIRQLFAQAWVDDEPNMRIALDALRPEDIKRINDLNFNDPAVINSAHVRTMLLNALPNACKVLVDLLCDRTGPNYTWTVAAQGLLTSPPYVGVNELARFKEEERRVKAMAEIAKTSPIVAQHLFKSPGASVGDPSQLIELLKNPETSRADLNRFLQASGLPADTIGEAEFRFVTIEAKGSKLFSKEEKDAKEAWSEFDRLYRDFRPVTDLSKAKKIVESIALRQDEGATPDLDAKDKSYAEMVPVNKLKGHYNPMAEKTYVKNMEKVDKLFKKVEKDLRHWTSLAQQIESLLENLGFPDKLAPDLTETEREEQRILIRKQQETVVLHKLRELMPEDQAKTRLKVILDVCNKYKEQLAAIKPQINQDKYFLDLLSDAKTRCERAIQEIQDRPAAQRVRQIGHNCVQKDRATGEAEFANANLVIEPLPNGGEVERAEGGNFMGRVPPDQCYVHTFSHGARGLETTERLKVKLPPGLNKEQMQDVSQEVIETLEEGCTEEEAEHMTIRIKGGDIEAAKRLYLEAAARGCHIINESAFDPRKYYSTFKNVFVFGTSLKEEIAETKQRLNEKRATTIGGRQVFVDEKKLDKMEEKFNQKRSFKPGGRISG